MTYLLNEPRDIYQQGAREAIASLEIETGGTIGEWYNSLSEGQKKQFSERIGVTSTRDIGRNGQVIEAGTFIGPNVDVRGDVNQRSVGGVGGEDGAWGRSEWREATKTILRDTQAGDDGAQAFHDMVTDEEASRRTNALITGGAIAALFVGGAFLASGTASVSGGASSLSTTGTSLGATGKAGATAAGVTTSGAAAGNAGVIPLTGAGAGAGAVGVGGAGSAGSAIAGVSGGGAAGGIFGTGVSLQTAATGAGVVTSVWSLVEQDRANKDAIEAAEEANEATAALIDQQTANVNEQLANRTNIQSGIGAGGAVSGPLANFTGGPLTVSGDSPLSPIGSRGPGGPLGAAERLVAGSQQAAALNNSAGTPFGFGGDLTSENYINSVLYGLTNPNLIGAFNALEQNRAQQALQTASTLAGPAFGLDQAAFQQGLGNAAQAFGLGQQFAGADFSQAQDFARRNFGQARDFAQQNFADALNFSRQDFQQGQDFARQNFGTAAGFADASTFQNNLNFRRFLDPRAEAARDRRFDIANTSTAPEAFARARQLRAPVTPVGAGGGGSRLDARDFTAAFETEEAQRDLQFNRLGILQGEEENLTRSLQERASSFLNAAAAFTGATGRFTGETPRFTGEGSRFINDTGGSFLGSIAGFDPGLSSLSTLAGLAPSSLAGVLSGLGLNSFLVPTQARLDRENQDISAGNALLLALLGRDPVVANTTPRDTEQFTRSLVEFTGSLDSGN